MRTYQDLTPQDQDKAVEKSLTELLQAILEGAIHFSDKDNGDDLQARINLACSEADRMQTPWFAHEYIMETCEEELQAIAEADAEEALYPEAGERIIQI